MSCPIRGHPAPPLLGGSWRGAAGGRLLLCAGGVGGELGGGGGVSRGAPQSELVERVVKGRFVVATFQGRCRPLPTPAHLPCQDAAPPPQAGRGRRRNEGGGRLSAWGPGRRPPELRSGFRFETWSSLRRPRGRGPAVREGRSTAVRVGRTCRQGPVCRSNVPGEVPPPADPSPPPVSRRSAPSPSGQGAASKRGWRAPFSVGSRAAPPRTSLRLSV